MESAKADGYEEICARVAQEVARIAGDEVSRLDYGLKNRWPGESGCKHQIDVSIVTSRKVLLAECKRWRSKVKPADILAFIMRCKDIRPTLDKEVHGFVFTTKGYFPGARQLAIHYGIEPSRVESVEQFAVKLGNHIVVGAGNVDMDLR